MGDFSLSVFLSGLRDGKDRVIIVNSFWNTASIFWRMSWDWLNYKQYLRNIFGSWTSGFHESTFWGFKRFRKKSSESCKKLITVRKSVEKLMIQLLWANINFFSITGESFIEFMSKHQFKAYNFYFSREKDECLRGYRIPDKGRTQ